MFYSKNQSISLIIVLFGGFIWANPMLWSQEQNISYLVQESAQEETAYLLHTVVKGDTYYNLSKKYGVAIDAIKKLNPMQAMLSLGQSLRIPLNSSLLKYQASDGTNKKDYVPVRYKVQKQETLFRICRRKFDLPIAKVLAMNQLNSNRIQDGQVIVLGWLYLPTNSVETVDTEIASSAPLPVQEPIINEQISKSTSDSIIQKKEKALATQNPKYEVLGADSGLAMWDKKMKHSAGTFVLHKYAAVGSLIELTNPMFDRTVYAKVVGNIPSNVYAEDPLIIVSPNIARQLNVLDAKFFVKIRYLRPELSAELMK